MRRKTTWPYRTYLPRTRPAPSHASALDPFLSSHSRKEARVPHCAAAGPRLICSPTRPSPAAWPVGRPSPVPYRPDSSSTFPSGHPQPSPWLGFRPLRLRRGFDDPPSWLRDQKAAPTPFRSAPFSSPLVSSSLPWILSLLLM